jgi:hypothetical protein
MKLIKTIILAILFTSCTPVESDNSKNSENNFEEKCLEMIFNQVSKEHPEKKYEITNLFLCQPANNDTTVNFDSFNIDNANFGVKGFTVHFRHKFYACIEKFSSDYLMENDTLTIQIGLKKPSACTDHGFYNFTFYSKEIKKKPKVILIKQL